MKKNNLDEMQEQRLLKIEENGCWLVFWALLLAILVQVLVRGFDWKTIAGEWIVFLLLSVYLMAACVRAGIWDRRFNMDAKTNALVSLVAAVAFGGFLFLVSYIRFRKPEGGLIAAGIGALIVFVGCWATLSVMAKVTKKRQEKLNAEPEEEA